jgi:hypothetical protein
MRTVEEDIQTREQESLTIGARLTGRIADLTGLDVSLVHTDTHFNTVLTTQSADPESIDFSQRSDTVYMASGKNDQSLTIQTPFVRGDASVLVVLQRSVREAMLPYVEARRGLLAFGAALIVLVAIAGGWFATTISRPLQTLGAAARRRVTFQASRCRRQNSLPDFKNTNPKRSRTAEVMVALSRRDPKEAMTR